MKRIGLTLGKYAPLHKGHQMIFERMAAENDEAVVIIYDTDVTPVPLPVRAGWIRSLHPGLRVIEAWDGCPEPEPDSAGAVPAAAMREYEQNEARYVQSLLAGTKVTGFYCSEYYGAHMSKALGCRDVRVDEARNTVPISAGMIRQAPYRYREFVDPAVYRDLIVKAVFVGAMSTGKSTLTETLASRFNTAYAAEYGRDYWTEHQQNRRIGLDEFDAIADGHIAREDTAVLGADRYFFVDTNAVTTYMYSLDYCGAATEHLTRTALENAARYDLFFLCMDDIPYDDTWDRSGDAKRHVFQKQIIADLEMRRIPYIPLYGDLETRVKRVGEVLGGYLPYRNYFGRRSSP